jgi:hypothetical protein
MTSSGHLLAGSIKDKSGLARGLQEVLDSYAKLPEEERRPKRVDSEEKPQLPPPPGGLVLTIYDRPLGRIEKGRYRLPEGDDLGGPLTTGPAGQRSSLWLKAEECQSLVPTNPVKGQTHNVPTKLAKRICLFGLWPNTLWVVEQSWQADSFREGGLNLTVAEVSPQTIRMRIHGSVLLSAQGILKRYPTGKKVKDLENRYEARLEGVLVYDRTQNRIVRWDMVALGDYTGSWFTARHGWVEATREAPLALAFALEVDRTAYELPPERRRPRSFVHAYMFQVKEEHYWDPEKWEEDWKKRQKQ